MASRVTVLGLGLMGTALSLHLIRNHYDVTVWNRSPGKCVGLANEGATVAPNLHEALANSETVLLSLIDYSIARALFNEHSPDLEGRTVINLMTGSPAEAEEFAGFITSLGGDYLDGAIEAYPEDIGGEGTLISFSGSEAAWNRNKPMLTDLAGQSGFVGSSPGKANVLDTAMAGAFCNVALGAFHEAVSFADASGVEISHIRGSLEYWLALLRKLLHESLDAITQDDYSTTQATLDVYVAAVHTWRQTMLDAGGRVSLMSANMENLVRARAAGYGQDAISAQFKTARGPSTLSSTICLNSRDGTADQDPNRPASVRQPTDSDPGAPRDVR